MWRFHFWTIYGRVVTKLVFLTYLAILDTVTGVDKLYKLENLFSFQLTCLKEVDQIARVHVHKQQGFLHVVLHHFLLLSQQKVLRIKPVPVNGLRHVQRFFLDSLQQWIFDLDFEFCAFGFQIGQRFQLFQKVVKSGLYLLVDLKHCPFITAVLFLHSEQLLQHVVLFFRSDVNIFSQINGFSLLLACCRQNILYVVLEETHRRVKSFFVCFEFFLLNFVWGLGRCRILLLQKVVW